MTGARDGDPESGAARHAGSSSIAVLDEGAREGRAQMGLPAAEQYSDTGSPLTDFIEAPRIRPMDYRQRIVIDPEIRFGKPIVRGTRISVGDVLSYLASGMSEDQVLADFPVLTRDDIRACLAFAAERERTLRSNPAA